MIPAIVIFALTYILMLIFGKYRPYIALAAGLIFIATGILPLGEIWGSIDFNVILMIAGTMGLVALFTESKMPMLLADLIMEKVPNVKWAAVALSLFSGFISAFVDNVATVLMIAPIALAICKKLGTNPVPFIIAVAVSSNLQGAATLIGDTTAIMLGTELDMSFLDFFWFHGKPSIFFAVELGAVLSALILLVLFRKETAAVGKAETRTKVTDYVPTILLVLALVFLIAVSFIDNKPAETNGYICVALMVIGLIYTLAKSKSFRSIVGPLKEIDFTTIGILLGLFLLIGGLESKGVIAAAANLLKGVGSDSPFLLYTILVWASVLLSAFIDNIPYVATMLPIITGLANAGLDPIPLCFGL
ncbi:MAG: arsenic transporter, partial [Clostridia bacterium]|nr:arsenic transporter [Clostridia bacterium]